MAWCLYESGCFCVVAPNNSPYHKQLYLIALRIHDLEIIEGILQETTLNIEEQDTVFLLQTRDKCIEGSNLHSAFLELEIHVAIQKHLVVQTLQKLILNFRNFYTSTQCLALLSQFPVKNSSFKVMFQDINFPFRQNLII